jgi:nucleoside-diphosphate-sugar epimerase
MTQYVIFGGSGFIGRHLAAHLSQRHPEAAVTVADIRPSSSGARHIHCDVRKPIDLALARDTEVVVFNLAAVHTTPGHPDHEYFETNILGAQNVCDFARQAGVRAMLFASSIAPYGPSEDAKTEETLPMPTTPYGISKLVAEKIHMVWQAERADRTLTIARPGIVFGKHEGGNFTRLYHALDRGLFAYPGRRDTLKAAIYVKDLVRLMDEMVARPLAPLQLYNYCMKSPPRIDTIVETMQQVIGKRRPVPRVPALPLKLAASVLGLPGFSSLGFHPDRVRKLMVSTNVDGSKLDRDYPLEYTLQAALEDWWRDCDRQGLL